MPMSEITYFDCACRLGRQVNSPEGQPETPAEILAAMDHYGIHEAMVIDSLACSTSPRAGNERILQRTADQPRLHPAWAGLMTHSEELAAPDRLVEQMLEYGVGALWLFYGQFAIPLREWAIGDLLGALEDAGAPLFLCPDSLRAGGVDRTDWSGVVDICHAHPRLNVAVSEYRIYAGQRPLYEALARCENLHLDISSIWLHKRIEYICSRFGSDRLLFSGQLPQHDPGVRLGQLNYSDISEAELADIAGGTMRRLLEWNPQVRSVADTVDLPAPVDEFHQKARGRVCLSTEEFYDCHGHIGWSSPNHVINEGIEQLVGEMDRLGLRTVCVFSLEGVMGEETWGNDRVAEVIARYPERFVGFTLVNPVHGERAMLEELDRGLQMGMQGIKLIPHYQLYPEEGPLIDVACHFADEHEQLILNHNWGSPDQMRRLCETYTRACFITGHSRGDYGEVVADVENLYICSCPFLSWGQTERYVSMYGADRIMFGSDLTDLPVAWGLGPILYARISEADKRKILGENLLGVMKRYGVRSGPA